MAESTLTATEEHAVMGCGAARAPRQARGQRRVDGILDAAEAVVAEVGVADAAVQEIARRACASVGSMYHFFPTKDAIIAALIDRYTLGLQEVAVSITMGAQATAQAPLEEFVDALVDPFASFIAANPGYLVLSRARDDGQLAGRVGTTQRGFGDAICGTLETALSRRFPNAAAEDWALRASMLHALGGAVLSLMTQGAAEERERLFREFKRAVAAYLASCERDG
jgi:AcrR family transcriptional regulator